MDKNWFPFFSMLFWWFTKVVGLIAFLWSFTGLVTLFLLGGPWFGTLVLNIGLPAIVGLFLLATDVMHDVATAGMRSKMQSPG